MDSFNDINKIVRLTWQFRHTYDGCIVFYFLTLCGFATDEMTPEEHFFFAQRKANKQDPSIPMPNAIRYFIRRLLSFLFFCFLSLLATLVRILRNSGCVLPHLIYIVIVMLLYYYTYYIYTFLSNVCYVRRQCSMYLYVVLYTELGISSPNGSNL